MTDNETPTAGPYWYRLVVDDGCVLCGRGAGETRERVYGERPDDESERVVYASQSACASHFM